MALSAGADGSLPTAFQICAPGLNRSTSGDFDFTPESAKLVLADFAASSADGMIDLQHFSIPDPDLTIDSPDKHDAMGWYSLEVRPDGSLWAVNVHWSDEGARRLRMKLQRYISPVVLVNKETREVCGLWNLALVSQPAMLDAPPLVAASKRVGELMLSRAAHTRAVKFVASYNQRKSANGRSRPVSSK